MTSRSKILEERDRRELKLLRCLLCLVTWIKFSQNFRSCPVRTQRRDHLRSLPIPLLRSESLISAPAGNHVLPIRPIAGSDSDPRHESGCLHWLSAFARVSSRRSYRRRFCRVRVYVRAALNKRRGADFAPSNLEIQGEHARARALSLSLSLSLVPQDYASDAMNLPLRGQVEIVTAFSSRPFHPPFARRRRLEKG